MLNKLITKLAIQDSTASRTSATYSDYGRNFKEMRTAIPSTELYSIKFKELKTVQGQGKIAFHALCMIEGQVTDALEEAYDKIKSTTKKLPDGSVTFVCGWDSQLEKILTTKLKPYFVGMKELKEVTPYSIKHYMASNRSIEDYFTDNLGYSKTKFEKHLAKRTIHKVNPKDPTTFPNNFIKRMKRAEAIFVKQITRLQYGIKDICKF